MDLTKEAIQELTQLRVKPEDHIVWNNGEIFEVDNNGKVRQIFTEVEGIAKEPLRLSTLSSLVNYIKANEDRSDETHFLHIESNKKVTLKSKLVSDGRREVLVEVNAKLPTFNFETYYDSEQFLIALNSKFVDTTERKELISFAGNVKEENARQTSDDGFSQKTSVKRGIASLSDELVPNPVVLTPYRTFMGVKQVASSFIFRMAQGPQFALFEADGGAWINEAIAGIEEYLYEALRAEITDGRIVVLA